MNREIERFARALATGWLGPFYLDLMAGLEHSFSLFLFGALTGAVFAVLMWSAGPIRSGDARMRPLPRKGP